MNKLKVNKKRDKKPDNRILNVQSITVSFIVFILGIIFLFMNDITGYYLKFKYPQRILTVPLNNIKPTQNDFAITKQNLNLLLNSSTMAEYQTILRKVGSKELILEEKLNGFSLYKTFQKNKLINNLDINAIYLIYGKYMKLNNISEPTNLNIALLCEKRRQGKKREKEKFIRLEVKVSSLGKINSIKINKEETVKKFHDAEALLFYLNKNTFKDFIISHLLHRISIQKLLFKRIKSFEKIGILMYKKEPFLFIRINNTLYKIQVRDFSIINIVKENREIKEIFPMLDFD